MMTGSGMNVDSTQYRSGAVYARLNDRQVHTDTVTPSQGYTESTVLLLVMLLG